MPILHSNYSSTQTCGHKQTLKSPPQRVKPSITKVLISHKSLMRLHIFSQPGVQPYWETASGKLVDSSPPAVWAITVIQERSDGLLTNMRPEVSCTHWRGRKTDTNTYKIVHKQHTRGWQVCAHPWTYQTRAKIPLLPLKPYNLPTAGWQDPSCSKLLTHSCTCRLPADHCSSVFFREYAHTGFHCCEEAEYKQISLLCTVVTLTCYKWNSNSRSPFYQIN